jgi:hypothetical protein
LGQKGPPGPDLDDESKGERKLLGPVVLVSLAMRDARGFRSLEVEATEAMTAKRGLEATGARAPDEDG